jgi:hypothetical protein
MHHQTADHAGPVGEGASRVALLGTLGSLHAEPLRYDLARLRALVETLEPDLLGVEADPQTWERGDAGAWPLEVREALAPAAGRTDTVIVPLGGPSPLEFAPPDDGGLVRLRTGLIRSADRLLISLQRVADSPEALSGGLVTHVCGLLCGIKEAASGEVGRNAWAQTNEAILDGLLRAARRDPGRRVLVAVRCHRIHWLRARLRRLSDEIELVPFAHLTAIDRRRRSSSA